MPEPIAVHTITQANAIHVLAVLGHGGSDPGGFMTKLIEAALAADQHNLERLARGFEGVVSAVRLYKEVPGGLEQLRGIADPTPF